MEYLAFLSTFWYGVVLLLHLAVILYILYSKAENPIDALFWLLVVTLIPVGGMVVFCFFGITRVRHTDLKIRRVQSKLQNQRERILGSEISRLERALNDCKPAPEIAARDHNRTLDRLFPQSTLLDGNSLELLRDGIQVYPRMLEDIAAARKSIRLESFIFMGDDIGVRILEALEKKAAEGVDVKILYDSFGSCKAYFSQFFRRAVFARRKNFQIRAFSPINLLAPWRFQMRNHRKILVIDGRIAYSGGINISEENEHLDRVPPSRYIHDLHCRITGPAVSQFQLAFFYDWAYTTRRKLGEIAVPGDFPLPKQTGSCVVRVLESTPGSRNPGTRNLFFAAAALARESLTIMTPYLVPGPEYIQALCMAAARGVKVQIIVPSNNNHAFVDLAAQSQYRRLLESGVRIFEKKGFFSHTKALLVDCEWGFMGSSNCDSRSFQLNFELDFCFEGGLITGSMCEQIQKELAESEEISLYRIESKTLLRRMLENICALASPIL